MTTYPDTRITFGLHVIQLGICKKRTFFGKEKKSGPHLSGNCIPTCWGAWTKVELEYLMKIIDGLGATDNAMTFDR